MKKTIAIGVCLAALGLGGCATTMPQGVAFTNVKLPVSATSNTAGAEKMGTATCQSILNLVATGDCSIQAAMKEGGITKITHVDWDANNILGIIGNYKLTVYGH